MSGRLSEEVVPTVAGEHRTVHSTAPIFDAMREGGVELDGAWLAQVGLPLPRAMAETCFFVHLKRL